MRLSALCLLLAACAPAGDPTPLGDDASAIADDKATPGRAQLDALAARVAALEAQNAALEARLAATETGLAENTAADAAAQDHNSSRSNKTASAIADLSDALGGEGVLLGADTDGDGEYDTFTGTGTLAALGAEVEAVAAAQDHNSSRSNKTASAIADLTDALGGEDVLVGADTDGDGDYDTFTGTGRMAALTAGVAALGADVEAVAAAQDHNSSRSNKTASAIADLSDALGGEGVLVGEDTDGDGDVDTFTGLGTLAALGTEVEAVAAAQDHNSSRSNKTASAIADLADALGGEGVLHGADTDGDGDYDAFTGTGELAALGARVGLSEDALLAVGALEVAADGSVVDSTLLSDYIAGIGAVADGVVDFFDAWPTTLDAWAADACAADPTSATCTALTETAALTREKGSGMATGRRQYQPLLLEP